MMLSVQRKKMYVLGTSLILAVLLTTIFLPQWTAFAAHPAQTGEALALYEVDPQSARVAPGGMSASVEINTEALLDLRNVSRSAAPSSVLLSFDLPDGRTFQGALQAVSEEAGSDAFSASGPLVDVGYGEWHLGAFDDVVVIGLNVAGQYFQILPDASGNYQISTLDQNLPTADLSPEPPESLRGEFSDAAFVGETDSAELDVLVVYTMQAVQRAGDESTLRAKLSMVETETNYGMQQSMINHQLNIVHSAAIVFDQPIVVWPPSSSTLSQLTMVGDGVLDEVHQLRAMYHADIVVMVVNELSYNGQSICGQAWQMSSYQMNLDFAKYAFAIIAEPCMVGNYSFPHEIGHLLGSLHDPYNAGGSLGAYDYSYGYQDPDGDFRTIMAYDDGCPNDTCPRVNYWSNPDVLINGKPAGTDLSNNANSLHQTAFLAERFSVGLPQGWFSMIFVPLINR